MGQPKRTSADGALDLSDPDATWGYLSTVSTARRSPLPRLQGRRGRGHRNRAPDRVGLPHRKRSKLTSHSASSTRPSDTAARSGGSGSRDTRPLEVHRLIKTLEAVPWTGRPGYPLRAMVGTCLVKSLYALNTWGRAMRLVAEHEGLQRALGAVPSCACYRFARQLRERDGWTLEQTVIAVVGSLREIHPGLGLGKNIAIDAGDLPAYPNGNRASADDPREPSDPDATLGYHSPVSTRAAGHFWGLQGRRGGGQSATGLTRRSRSWTRATTTRGYAFTAWPAASHR